MPADGNHPERGYLSAGQSVGSYNTFTMAFQLPVGLVGDEILLQWKYITANSCSPEGYTEYFNTNDLPDSYWTPGLLDLEIRFAPGAVTMMERAHRPLTMMVNVVLTCLNFSL
jgi:hypothetical protein